MRLSFAELGAAILLPLTLLAVFPAPEGTSALGMALAWLACMLLAGLPASFLEFALVRRARQMPLQGMAQLTRDADARTTWRGLIPFGMVILAALAALSSGSAADFVPVEPEWMGQAAPWLLLAVAAGMTWVGVEKLLGLGGVLALGAMSAAVYLAEPELTWSAPGVDAWRLAALAALLATGSGLGIQAWLAHRRLADGGAVAAVVPFWGVQALSGVLVILAGDLRHQPAACAYLVPALFAVALMLQVLVQQLVARGRGKPVAVAAAVAGVGVLTLAALQPTFTLVVKLLALLPLLVLSVFVGWVMKISHVRKALNLPSEGLYNLWRVAVRLVLPLLCLWVIAGVLL
jgi:hypothetical protein